jgi:hypothetical protein
MFEEIQRWANSLPRYSFEELHKLNTVSNGIYLVFEKGEKFENFDRIVRVGSHPSQGRFYKRLQDHFFQKQISSIMRKHIGRCFLNMASDPYITIWNFSNTGVKKGSPGEKKMDWIKEMEIESNISDYLNNFTITIISGLNNQAKRMELETKLIATLNGQSSNFISQNWLGLSHPDSKISTSGLWNIQGLNSNNYINKDDFEFLKQMT